MLDLQTLIKLYKAQMQVAGLTDTDELAMRLACVWRGTYILTIALGHPIHISSMSGIKPEHREFVAGFLSNLAERIEAAIEME